ncbi:NUDIX domain-containing protein [Candidatus Gracilibacteria bacterium]|nr:NUDIX domain-containing protein [Candidatus Gracilibacteria bacterium]MCF7819520.1 NUDIX domain-containing protein [Candidatus Gracilibacteria bacterium]
MIDVWLPSSKSVSLRALVLNFLNGEKTDIRNMSECDDVRFLKNALSSFFISKEEEFFVGDGGAPARFLAVLSLVAKDPFVIRGTERFHQRPMKDLFYVLRSLGVKIECLDKKDFLPARFQFSNLASRPKKLPTEVKLSGKVSSQFLSGLLLVAPSLPNGLNIQLIDDLVSRPYVQMTLQMLRMWGADVRVSPDFRTFTIIPGFSPPAEFVVPSDMTAVSYPIVYSMLSRQSIMIHKREKETLQGDERILEIIRQCGAQVRIDHDQIKIIPPKQFKLPKILDMSDTPDLFPSVAVLASFAERTSCFEGVGHLQWKESDRIHALQENLEKLGIEMKYNDGCAQIGENSQWNKKNVHDKKINSFQDHRIAMIFGVLNKVFDLDLDISHPECVSKSWPGFWLDLASWAGELRDVAAVIVCHKGKYLVVKKPRKDYAWQFPQGGVETEETFLQAVKRELQEECGKNLDVDFGRNILGQYKYFFPTDFHRHEKKIRGAHVRFFRAEFVQGRVEINPKELEDFAWVEKEKLSEYFAPEYWKVVQQWV